MMTEPQEQLGLYLHLARASEQRLRPMVRDKFLVLAGVCACELALDQIAAFCRHKVLENNPGHLLRKYKEFAAAIGDESFETYLKQLQRAYPLEKSEFMLQSLGIDLGNERAAYYSDHEYAAALLGTTPDKLDEMFKPGVVDEPAAGEGKKNANGAPSSALDDDTDDGSLDLFSDRKPASDPPSSDEFRVALSSAPSLPPAPLDPLSNEALSIDPSDALSPDVLSNEPLPSGSSALDDAVLDAAGASIGVPPEKPKTATNPSALAPKAPDDSFEATIQDLTQSVANLEKPVDSSALAGFPDAIKIDEDDEDDDEVDDPDEAATDDIESALDEEPVSEEDRDRSSIGRVAAMEQPIVPDEEADSILLSARPAPPPTPAQPPVAPPEEKAPVPAPAAAETPRAPFEDRRDPNRPGSVLFDKPVPLGAPPTEKIVDAPTVPDVEPVPPAAEAAPVAPAIREPAPPEVRPAAASAVDNVLFDAPTAGTAEPDSWFPKKPESTEEHTKFYAGSLLDAARLEAQARENAAAIPEPAVTPVPPSASAPPAAEDDAGDIHSDIHSDLLAASSPPVLEAQVEDILSQQTPAAKPQGDEAMEDMLFGGTVTAAPIPLPRIAPQAPVAAPPVEPTPAAVSEPEPAAEAPAPAPAAPAPPLDDDDENVLGGPPREREIGPRYSFVGTLPVTQHTSFENLHATLTTGQAPSLNLFVRADSHPSLEAVEEALMQVEHPELSVRLQATVGSITEADVDFADVMNAIIIGYNVTPDANVLPLAKRRGVQIRQYTSVERISEDLRLALEGLLGPEGKKTAPFAEAPAFAAAKAAFTAPPVTAEPEPPVETPAQEVYQEAYQQPPLDEAPVYEPPVEAAPTPAPTPAPSDAYEPPVEAPPRKEPRLTLSENLPPPAPAPRLPDYELPRPAPKLEPALKSEPAPAPAARVAPPVAEDEPLAPSPDAPAPAAGSSTLVLVAGALAFLAAFAGFLIVLGMMAKP